MIKRILIGLAFVIFSPQSLAITGSQIQSAIDNNDTNPFTELVKSELGAELDAFEIYTEDGSLVFAGSKSYSYHVECRDREYLNFDVKVKFDSGADVFKTSYGRFNEEIKINDVIDVEIHLDGNVEFKEKYEGILGCETLYSVDADINGQIDAGLFIDMKAGFKGEQITSNKVVLTPYTDLVFYGDLDNAASVGVDIPTEYLVGFGATVGGILSLLSPEIGINAALVIIFGGEEELEDIVNEELDDLIQDYEDEINSSGGKREYTEHTPVEVEIPENNSLTDDEYRKLMRAEGYGGYNCGGGKDNQSEALLGLLSKDVSGYQDYIIPEIQCRDTLPVVFATHILF